MIGRNVRSGRGEVDILALAPDGWTVVVVEVKSGTPPPGAGGTRPLQPETHVSPSKQRQLVALACQVARAYRLTQRPLRFDVVGVDLPPGAPPVVRHHVAAFESHV